MVQLNFNANSVAPLEDRGAVPAGWYNVVMDKSEAKPTKDGAGMYLECQFAVADGVHKGARFWTRLNIRNNNPQAVEIAYRELSAIAHACGIMQVADSTMLHGIPLKVKVKVRKGDGNYDDQNEITSYKPANHNVEVVGAAPFGGAPGGGFQPPVGSPVQQQAFQPQQQQQAPQQTFQPPVQQQVQQPPQQQVQQTQQDQSQPWQQNQQQPWQQGQQPQQTQQVQQPPVQQQQQQQQPPQQTQQQVQQPGGGQQTPPWLLNQQ